MYLDEESVRDRLKVKGGRERDGESEIEEREGRRRRRRRKEGGMDRSFYIFLSVHSVGSSSVAATSSRSAQDVADSQEDRRKRQTNKTQG